VGPPAQKKRGMGLRRIPLMRFMALAAPPSLGLPALRFFTTVTLLATLRRRQEGERTLERRRIVHIIHVDVDHVRAGRRMGKLLIYCTAFPDRSTSTGCSRHLRHRLPPDDAGRILDPEHHRTKGRQEATIGIREGPLDGQSRPSLELPARDTERGRKSTRAFTVNEI